MQIKTNIQNILVKDEDGKIIKETIIDKVRNFELVSFFYKYDKSGKLIKEISDDGFGNSVIVSYQYDDKGRYIQICETEICEKQNCCQYTEKYFYDIHGNMTRKLRIYSTCNDVTDYFYDNNGNMIKSIKTDEFGEKVVITYEYDSAGNKINKTEYTPDGKAHRITSYAYDESGNVVCKEELTVSGIGSGFHKINEYYYNEKGYKSHKIIKYLNGDSEVEFVAEKRYFTNSDGKIIASKNKNCDYKNTRYYYNSQGRLTVTDDFSSNDGMNFLVRNIDWGHFATTNSFFNYEYDSQGNCVSISSQKIDGT